MTESYLSSINALKTSTHLSFKTVLICIFKVEDTCLALILFYGPLATTLQGQGYPSKGKLGSTAYSGHLAWVLWYEHRQLYLPRAKVSVVSYPWGVFCFFQKPSGFRDHHSLWRTPFILQSCRHGVNRTIAHNAGSWRNFTMAGVRQVVRFSWWCKCIT